MKGFKDFIREQGVVGLAVGFVLGAAVGRLVTALVSDLINPVISLIVGLGGGLQSQTLKIGPAVFQWGNFVSTLIDFMVIAAVVYFGVKWLKLDKLDKKKED